MFRSITLNSMRLLLSALTAAALSVAVLPTPARAAGYVFQQHIVNAGVLVNGSDPAPYVFYVLNNRPDVRPTDLTLINPLASSILDPKQAAYWEVPLNSVSDSEMEQYNVLYLRADGIKFGPAINEKLRRFVDNGGQLIVEYGAPTAVATGLFTGTEATGAPSVTTLPAPGTVFLRHPIISQPYLLSVQDVNALTTAPNTAGALGANTNDPVHAGEYNSVFSPVLTSTAGAVVSTAQIGAGQVVVTTLSLGVGISVHNAATFVPADLYTSSAPDLKLLANILTWEETHPNGGGKTSHGNASGTGLASFSPAWQYPVQGSATPSTPPGAAVWGNFVYAVDSTGALTAFDAYPSENLTNSATAVLTGAETALSTYPTTSYDQIWTSAVGRGASAPMVASFNGVNYVFVEKVDGSVVAFNAVTGTSATLPATPSPLPSVASVPYSSATMANAPSPTYYDGRLYAGQANGTLAVYDLNENSSITVLLNQNTILTGPAEYVTGSPSVGTLADGDTNVLTALVPTNYNLYTVLLGARNEPLATFSANGALAGYHINRYGRYNLNTIFADLNAVPSLLAYDYSGNVNSTPPNSTAPNPQDPLFPIINYTGYYTDWDIDFANSTNIATGGTPIPVNLNYVSTSTYLNLTGTLTPGAISAPVIDRHGDYYYTQSTTDGSTLVGVHNSRSYTGVRQKFRFQIPASADATTYNGSWDYTDADGVNYSGLFGYQFAGAPVVDDQDNVYVLAVGGGNARVLCFRGDQEVSAALPASAIGAGGTPTIDLVQGSTITQGNPENSIQRGDSNAAYGQFTSSATTLSFYNFGRRGRVSTELAGNLIEPQPVTATSTDAVPVIVQLNLRTNLGWYTAPFPYTSAMTGLSRVGGSLFLTDGAKLYRLSTTPQIGALKQVTIPPFESPVGGGAVGAGTVGAAPSVGGSVLVVTGQNGLATLTRQVTVIADNNRILGVDGDGSAVWSVDATTRSDVTTNFSTKVQFSHPTSLSQFALNDYLVADTGNNRCVRFDSGGNVQWELTRFQDLNGLMGSGQPLTLSQPTSVVTRTAIVPAAATQYPGDTATYYLVADSGNDRVLEVADFVSTAGNLDASHVLTWVSHTGDQYGRHYRYGCATYYPNATAASSYSIAATVTNTRVAPLTTAGALGPVSADAPGGSLVVFSYPATVYPFNQIPTGANDLVYTTAGFYANTGTTASPIYAPFTIRNPRFLQLNSAVTAASPQTGVPAFDFLYADDNGAFDLTYVTAQKAFIAPPGRLQFKTTDYAAMTSPAVGVTGTPARARLAFVPTCVQIVGSSTTYPRYLITQSYSQGELGGAAGQAKLGGEIFEVDGDTTAGTEAPVGGFGGSTLSHPALTGPLTQPTFGVRLP